MNHNPAATPGKQDEWAADRAGSGKVETFVLSSANHSTTHLRTETKTKAELNRCAISSQLAMLIGCPGGFWDAGSPGLPLDADGRNELTNTQYQRAACHAPCRFWVSPSMTARWLPGIQKYF